jgi:hypothetical protein
MSEIINLEIKADQSGADEALKQVNKSLKEGTEAAEALNHVLDGDLAGTFKSLGELSKTLGIDLGLAFSPAEIIAFAQVVAEVADKLSKLIADTFIYTDAMKGQDAALKTANKSLEDNAARIKVLDRETQLAAAQGAIAKEKLRLAFILEDLGGDPKALKAKMDEAIGELARLRTETDKITNAPPKFKLGAVISIDEKTSKIDEAQAKMANLENAINAYASAIRVAEAETKKTGQTIKNDLAAEADKAAKDKKREQDALAAAAEKTAKDKKKEQDELDAWVTHAVRSRGTLTEAVKRMAKEQAQADVDANLALAKSEEARIAKINADEKAAAEQEKERQDEVYKGAIEVAKLASDKKIQLIEQDLERGKINQQQEIAAIAQEKERELEIEKLTQQKRWALWDGDKKKQQEVQNQIDKIVAQSKLVQTKAVTDGLKAQEQQYRQVFSQIGNAFKTEILGMIQGTETVTQAFSKMFNSLVSSFANYVAQKAEKKAEEWLIDKLFTEKKIGSETAAATGIASMAGFASAMQALPFPINVSTAPAVAAAAGATASGMGAIAMGAASLAIGTDYVPMDGLAYLHKGEKVIPASMQGPGYSGGAGITIVVNHSVSAVDAASFQGHIRRHSNMIANEVTRALKRKGVR